MTPYLAYSFAIDFIIVMRPAFEAAYAAIERAPPALPADDPMPTIRP